MEEGELEVHDLAAPGGGEKAWWQLRKCQPVLLRNTNLIGEDIGEQVSLANLVSCLVAGLLSHASYSWKFIAIRQPKRRGA